MFDICQITVNYQHNPLGIDAAAPLFAWKYAFASGLMQRAYRVRVAEKNGATVWDSGLCTGRKQTLVYGGKPLAYETEYTVSVWAESEKQETAQKESSFETGIAPEAFADGWLYSPMHCGGTQLLRQKFTLENRPTERARLYVCGLGCCDVFVNGMRISDEIMSPPVSEYHKRAYYVTYDITPYLHAGVNVIGYELGYGWFGARKLWTTAKVRYADGAVFSHRSGQNDWWMTGSPRVSASIYDGETYDAREEERLAGWCTADYTAAGANGWMIPVLTGAPTRNIKPAFCEPVRIAGDYPVLYANKLSPSVTVYDVGYNITGAAEIRVRGERGARISLVYAEGVREDGGVDVTNLRSAKCTDVYVLHGNGEETYCPRFTQHGFRYVQVAVAGKARILSLVGKHMHADTACVGSFTCSDETLNRLHDMAVRTEANNRLGTLTDCPQRDERFGWLNDWSARLFQTVYNFSSACMLEKLAHDVADGQTDTGGICDTAPYMAGGNPADPVSISFLLLGWLSSVYYGNDRILTENYHAFRAWVECLLTRQKGYIMDYSYYGDWVTPVEGTGKRADPLYVSSVFLLWHFEVLRKIAARIGKSADVALYAEHAENARSALRKKYYSGIDFANGTQTENALALMLRIVPQADTEKLAKKLYDDTGALGHHSYCGNQGYRPLFYALGDHGYVDEGIAVLKNPEYPGWGYMLACGATTVWERWEKELQAVMSSYNHPMFASYDAWFFYALGGIVIPDDADGCDVVEIRPRFARALTFADCSYKTPRGTVCCNWKRENGKIICKVRIPSNTVARIALGNKTDTVQSGEYTYEVEEV